MNVVTLLPSGVQPEPSDDQVGVPVAPHEPAAVTDIGIVVLSSDPGLLQILDQVSSALATITRVEDWAGLLEAVTHGRRSIVLLDADRVGPGQLDARLAELNGLAAAPVIVAAAGRDEAKAFMEALAAGQVHRLLLKPATLGGARLVLDYAIARSRQQSPHAAPAAAAPSGPHHRRGLLLAAGMAVIFVVTVIGAMTWRTPPAVAPVEETAVPEPAPVVRVPAPAASELQAPPVEVLGAPDSMAAAPDTRFVDISTIELLPVEAAVTEAAQVEAAVTEVEPVTEVPVTEVAETDAVPAPREIDELLERGEARLQAGALIRPQGDNAFSYYRRAAAIEASEPRVVALRARLGEAFVAAAWQALNAGDVPESESLLRWSRELGVNPAVLTDLAARVDALRAKQLAEQQAAHEAELLASGLERLRTHQLLAPEEDSAAFHLARLREENPEHPGLAAPWAALISTLAENVREAAGTADFAAADAWLDGLEQIDADATLIETLSAELAVARKQDEFLRVPAPAAELELIHFEPASYPRQALLRKIEGWVDVEFVVDHEGRPRDFNIAAAEPAGVFDRSAANAVGRYRYEPFVLDGHAYERRVAMRLIFTLD
jgi:periplasmic protein TonB